MSDDIRPFRIEIPQADLDYLHDRLANARWPGELPGVGWSRGVPLGYLKELAEYWRTPTTGAPPRRGLTSTRSSPPRSTASASTSCTSAPASPDAKPLMITHGFPSSVAEFLHLIEPLVNPAAGRPSTSSRRPCPGTPSRPR